MGVRRLIVVAIGVVALSLLGPTAAGAQTGVLTLTGERLDACHAERAGGVTFICLSPETGPDSFRATVRCNESGVNERVTWSASGIASGPYPGTFTETGSAVATNGRVTALVVEFHIESVLGDVDGRKFIHPDEVAPFACVATSRSLRDS